MYRKRNKTASPKRVRLVEEASMVDPYSKILYYYIEKRGFIRRLFEVSFSLR